MKNTLKYQNERYTIRDSVMVGHNPRIINEDNSYKTLCDLEKKIKKNN
jgi:hypothetical protein